MGAKDEKELKAKSGWSALYLKEDWWAIWLALTIIVLALIFYAGGSTVKAIAVEPPKWGAPGDLWAHLADKWYWYIAQFAMWLLIFTASVRIMGLKVGEYVRGFIVLYALSALVIFFANWKYASNYNLEAPLVALILGLLLGNFLRLPKWLDTSFRTEYYIKTGIILLGATLPFTIILSAGWVALLQATIVSVTTFMTIYYAATKIFGLDRRFGACMGAGGSVCGVSATIAVGGAVRAEKEHVAIGISIVAIWAIVMIFVLPIASKALHLDAGIAGAWIGTSEFADAAGFAAAATIGSEKAIRSYTLMKVIGRDIWIGVWSFILAIISVTIWEKKEGGERRVRAMEIWYRFPKFVLGFFLASAVITIVSASVGPEMFEKGLKPLVIAPIKTLRTWTFLFTFLSIGLTTRFRELTRFGWAAFLAFTIGVAINVPVGFILSNFIFRAFWTAIPSL
jgi:uncharacterized integral membrane protein (TIGR00698 family)